MKLLKWLEAGEEIRVIRRGVVVARLVSENHAKTRRVVWRPAISFTRIMTYQSQLQNLAMKLSPTRPEIFLCLA
jgi:antitoxin (DNA-binding transcriptional repressor) of toxin-antitoxin stability system